jgi:hypothetical protein
MQALQTPHHSLQVTPTLRTSLPSSTGELFAEDGPDRFASRCEPQMLVARAKHTDPYATWLNQREAERDSAIATTVSEPAGRFGRNQPAKAPWAAIRVTLSRDRW